MRDASVPSVLASRVLGTSLSTFGRRLRATAPTTQTRVRRAGPTHEAAARAKYVVRATRGLVGAASLGKRCGLSRRSAAAIKHEELVLMERERKAACARVHLAAAGVVRAFDAMHVPCVDGLAYWLIACDGALPYRTSIATVAAYDADSVISALEADFEAHGAPLVVRLDRISAQRTPAVAALLEHHGVLALHGPPRYPQYYGQLERQNRDHRAWLESLGPMTTREAESAGRSMITSLNALWARPTLAWCTPAEQWAHRAQVDIDRTELRHDVDRQVAGLVKHGEELLRARRIAIEAALVRRDLLTIESGGSC